ncbi:hypothetical protein [Paenibacillus periandrae]|uniref:hypothetical protein n=1 Tax=Paenibacillus periandrae TaxID=1761741 RepID=UPI001F09FF75|nr:hypothetical protein [Paenibacillus periandrae]
MKQIIDYHYDFKDEIEVYKQSQQGNLCKFLMYKSGIYEQYFDCDRSLLAKQVYNMLWGFNVSRYHFDTIRIGNRDILMGTDTMNSLQTVLAFALTTWCMDELRETFGINKITSQTNVLFLKDIQALKRIIIKNLSLEILEAFELFAGLTHTIGNFALVPKKLGSLTKGRQTFNTARYSYYRDYMDLSLHRLVNSDDALWDKETLITYRNIQELKSYMTEAGDIIPLVPRHSDVMRGVRSEIGPQTKEELLWYLNGVNGRIIERGKRLAERLA